MAVQGYGVTKIYLCFTSRKISELLFVIFNAYSTLDAIFKSIAPLSMKKILIIEDDKLISSLVQFRLKKEGYDTMLVMDGNQGVESIESYQPDLIITDVMMPYKSGIEVIQFARKNNPDIPIIVLSSLGEEEQVVLEAFNLGVSDFVPKPFNPNELAIRVKRVLNK